MDKYDEILKDLIRSQQRKIDILFSVLANDISIFVKRHTLHDKYDVWNQNLVVKDEIDLIFKQFRIDLRELIKSEVRNSWYLNNKKNDIIVRTYLKGTSVPKKLSTLLFDKNDKALFSFMLRKKIGASISKRVWNIEQQAKKHLELYLRENIHSGTPANKIASQLTQYLKNPDKVFRRVRDPKTGLLKLSSPAKKYNPGIGINRSSYGNALRMARTEINMAYHHSDYLRRRNQPFTIGVRVHLSNAHPKPDICDHMKGDYPKGFLFSGWHPQCLCYTTAKQIPKKDFIKLLNNEPVTIKNITTIPKEADRYIKKHSKAMKRWKNRPYFISNNFKGTEDSFTLLNRVKDDF